MIEEENKIRVNLLVDKDINPELFEQLKKVNKRKRAGIIKRWLEEYSKIDKK